MIRSDWASAIRMAHDFVRRLWSLKLRGASFESERETGSGASLEVSAKS